MRLFIALPLPEEYQAGLERVRDELAGMLRSRLTWTRPGNWHATLKFLGDVEEERVAGIVERLEEVEFSAFEFQAGGAGAFPNLRRPRVLWIGVIKGGAELAALAGAVDGTMVRAGFGAEERAFRAHLTLGRIRSLARDPWEEALKAAGGFGWPAFSAGEFKLYASELTKKGPHYTALGSFGC